MSRGTRNAMLALLVTQVLGFALLATVVLHAAERAVAAERAARVEAEQERQRQGEMGRRVTCSLVVAQDNVYKDTPPTTAAGIKAAKAWHDLREQFQCDGG